MMVNIRLLAFINVMAAIASPVPDVPHGPAPQGCSKYEIIIGKSDLSVLSNEATKKAIKPVEHPSPAHLAQLLGTLW
jgi:hypothetical protein